MLLFKKWTWIILALALTAHAAGQECTFHSSDFSLQLKEITYLLDHNLGFSDQVTFKDVLSAEQPVSDYYLEHNDLKHYFQLKELVIYILASRREITKASMLCKQLKERAEEMNYVPGKALAEFALGDIYLNCRMNQEALNAYRQAELLINLARQANMENVRELIFMQRIPLLIYMKQYGEAEQELKKMEKLYQIPINFLNPFLFYYFRCSLNAELKRIEEAQHDLDIADSLFVIKPSTYYEFYKIKLEAILAQLNSDNEKAANLYLQLADMANHSDIWLRREQTHDLMIKYHKLTLNDQEVCRIFKQMFAEKDSLRSQNYATQVNMIRAIYETDCLITDNDKRRQAILYYAASGILTVLLGMVIYILIVRYNNHRLICQRKSLEEARQQAENSFRSKSLFLSNMSHEIRTPLNALSGFSTLLTDASVDDEMRKQCSDIIEQNSELLIKLFNDIVDLSNIEQNNLTFLQEEVEAVSVCRHVVQTVERIKQTAAEVRFNSACSELKLTTDKSRLQQVLINLLINATKFTSQGYIELRLTTTENQEALFTIEDTGCGIPESEQERIFKRFEKLHEEAQGSGLGLSICQLIIEKSGGKIWLDTDYTAGSRFHFTIPLGNTNGKERKP